jgi:hypothetical protein
MLHKDSLLFLHQTDGLYRTGIRSLLAVTDIAFIRIDHPGLVISELINLRTNINARAATDTGFFLDNRFFHFTPLQLEMFTSGEELRL